MLQPVAPIDTLELFPGLSAELLGLLRGLTGADWQQPTACAGWTVQDVAAHLLGGSLGRLAFGRDRPSSGRDRPSSGRHRPSSGRHRPSSGRHRPSSGRHRLADAELEAPLDYAGLVQSIDRSNAAWVAAARRISPGLLVEFLALAEPQLYAYFKSLPPLAPAGAAVAWAGDAQSPNWFDIAREYTEKWLHQQHIRQAVGQPLLLERRWAFPVFDTFLRGLPQAYRAVPAPVGAAVWLQIQGDAGGDWTLLRRAERWELFSGAPEQPVAGAGAAVVVDAAACVCSAGVCLDQDLAWRLFTKGIGPKAARPRLAINGQAELAAPLLDLVAIMA